MAKDAIVSQEMADKFKTEKDSPYLRFVRGEGRDAQKASADFVRRNIWYDELPLEIHRCSLALHRLLETKDGSTLARCGINNDGIAVRPNRGPTVISLRKGRLCT
jgi:hypothetical protein